MTASPSLNYGPGLRDFSLCARQESKQSQCKPHAVNQAAQNAALPFTYRQVFACRKPPGDNGELRPGPSPFATAIWRQWPQVATNWPLSGTDRPYWKFEFTSLRQQVFNVREVTSPTAKNRAFGRISRNVSPRTCSRENPQRHFLPQIPKNSLNAQSRVQVCAPTWTREFALRLSDRARSQRTLDFVSAFERQRPCTERRPCRQPSQE